MRLLMPLLQIGELLPPTTGKYQEVNARKNSLAKPESWVDQELFHLGREIVVTPATIIELVIVIATAWLALRLFKRFGKRVINRKANIDDGRWNAFYQIIRYVTVVVIMIVCLEIIGISISLLLAGSAALLVGLGFGIQELFKDIISGVVLLFEGSISVGDILEVDQNLTGRVEVINIRTSTIETINGIRVIVPNSLLVSEKVVNWSHNRGATRFAVAVGVAYGSDVRLVSKLIVDAAREHPLVEKQPEPRAFFRDFGDSSLNFEVSFWTTEMMRIERVKSEIRYNIDAMFRNNGVQIPFPQRDLHIKTPPQTWPKA